MPRLSRASPRGPSSLLLCVGHPALSLLSHTDPAQLCSLVGHLPSLSSLESLRLRCKFLVSMGCISREPWAGPSCLIHFAPLALALKWGILTHDPSRPCRNTASYPAKGVSEEDGCFPCHTVVWGQPVPTKIGEAPRGCRAAEQAMDQGARSSAGPVTWAV